MTDDNITVYTDEETKACQQYVFNTAVSALRVQNKASKSKDGQYNYRSPDGSKCVIGQLIPDELYNHEIEGATVRQLYYNNILCHLLQFDPNKCGIKFLSDLQDAHDNWKYNTPFDNVSGAFREIAINYRLDTTVLD